MRAIALVPLLAALKARVGMNQLPWQRSRRVALMDRSATWLLPGMAFGRFRGTFRLSTRQCFGVTKFFPVEHHGVYEEKF